MSLRHKEEWRFGIILIHDCSIIDRLQNYTFILNMPSFMFKFLACFIWSLLLANRKCWLIYSHISRTSFLSNLLKLLLETCVILYRQNCKVWQSIQQCSSDYTILQTRRVWWPKSTSLVTKVDDFGFQGSKNKNTRMSKLYYRTVRKEGVSKWHTLLYMSINFTWGSVHVGCHSDWQRP